MNYYLIKLTSKNIDDVKKMYDILLDEKLGAYLEFNPNKTIFYKKQGELIEKSIYELSFYTKEELIPFFIVKLKEFNISTDEFSEFKVDRFSRLFEEFLSKNLKETKTEEEEKKKKLASIPRDAEELSKRKEYPLRIGK